MNDDEPVGRLDRAVAWTQDIAQAVLAVLGACGCAVGLQVISGVSWPAAALLMSATWGWSKLSARVKAVAGALVALASWWWLVATPEERANLLVPFGPAGDASPPRIAGEGD